jgi:hypothetical protein
MKKRNKAFDEKRFSLPGPKKLKWFIGITLTLAFFGLFVPSNKDKKPTVPPVDVSKDVKVPEKPVALEPEKPASEPIPTGAEYLQRAKALLSQKPKGASNDKQEHYLWKAENLLRAINPGSAESPEAERLLKKVKDQQILLFKKAAVDEEKNTAVLRKEYADKLEFTYLDKLHMDTRVTVSGKYNTTIKIKWILWSRVTVYEFFKDGKVLSQWREMGFKTYVLTDGYRWTWKDKI